MNTLKKILLLIVLIGAFYLVTLFMQSEKSDTSTTQTSDDVTITISPEPSMADENSIAFTVEVTSLTTDLTDLDFERSLYIEKDDQIIRATLVSHQGEGTYRFAVMVFPYVPTPFTIIGENIGSVVRREYQVDATPDSGEKKPDMLIGNNVTEPFPPII